VLDDIRGHCVHHNLTIIIQSKLAKILWPAGKSTGYCNEY